MERDRVIEIFIVENDDYEVKGPSSARVTITDNAAIVGDFDGNRQVDLKDLIIVLKICAGKDIPNVYLNDYKNIGLTDALYMLST
ncbi:hypothetical protein MHK_001714, partial [Candidatus Magnetomorum sp. HK-1]